MTLTIMLFISFCFWRSIFISAAKLFTKKLMNLFSLGNGEDGVSS
ncbi:hypothetical protein [Bacillus swezeyi]